MTEWDFGKLADQHRFKQSGATLTAYPCLRDKGDAAELGLAESEAEANRLSERGVLRLLLLRLPQQVKQARGKVLRGNEHQLQFATIGGDRHRWVEMMLLAAARDAFAISAGSLPRRAEEFDAVWEQGRSEFVATLEACEALMKEVLALYAGVRRTLKKANNLSWAHSVADINNQLSALFEGEFILAVDSERLQQYPRYIKAVQQRIDKLRGHFTRDRQCTLTLEPLQAQLQALIERKGEGIARHPLVEQYRWQLEEFRVSLFAQELGTQAPVSEKRLKILWKELQEAVTIT